MKKRTPLYCFSSCTLLLLAFNQFLSAQVPRPVYTYLDDFSFTGISNRVLTGPPRVVSLHGRKGLNMTSIRSVLEMKAHTCSTRRCMYGAPSLLKATCTWNMNLKCFARVA